MSHTPNIALRAIVRMGEPAPNLSLNAPTVSCEEIRFGCRSRLHVQSSLASELTQNYELEPLPLR
jgi:hypothetical protein